MTLAIVSAIFQIFGVFAVGWFARHLKYIQESELEHWSKFVIDFLFPALIFHSIVANFEAERLGELWPLPVVALGIIVLGTGVGYYLCRGIKSPEPALRKTFHHLCAINNYSFLPIIIVSNLWGKAALAYLFFFGMGSVIGYWTIGISLLGDSGKTNWKKQILTPSLAAIILALFFVITGWTQYLPDLVLKISGTVGSAAVPCILILIGASLYPLPKLTNIRDLVYLTFARLLFIPAILILILSFLPLSNDVRNIALIVALMPTSVSSTILTRRYGGDPDFAAQAALLTTIVSVVTVPLALWLLY